jgi:hypothetical protein
MMLKRIIEKIIVYNMEKMENKGSVQEQTRSEFPLGWRKITFITDTKEILD